MTEDIAGTIAGLPRTTVTGRVDLYRNVHKGLRHELLAVTVCAGRLDAADDERVVELLAQSHRLIDLLHGHHQHEEHPALHALIAANAPAVAVLIHDEHGVLGDQMDALSARADELAATPAGARAPFAHAYYLELAAFTGAYLAHLDVEERIVMPALAASCDDTELGPVQAAILASIRPEQQAAGLTMMLPALNPTERADLVGQMR